MSENHKQLGYRGEEIALRHLEAKGYRLRDRNFRTRNGEIDLVLDGPGGELVFVEVKTDRTGAAGAPEAWVDGKKIRRLQRMAQRYCWMKGQMERDMRFDVVGIRLQDRGPPALRHIENAFLPDAAGYY